ncbi:regulator of telomere elongation helicase 1 homolog isoform X2 [Anthonomus grandis grandis]|uniref:regulator of telomere elongation helicase 1 homolog isoform X2 n=1 Tax=Anthonomus grandis grandis TaxID=2921223 RepID=UPI0021658112|nr:regulator of telomere elongation helicase 1 homolog isoform X2 [Anthonomus grandis grandis]
MSVTTNIRGVPVTFPFQPYDIQVDYMEKVIECIQNETTAVLESPTGTGKTLSLLCSSLAWLQHKKAQLQGERQLASKSQIFTKEENRETPDFLKDLMGDMTERASVIATGREFLALPTIIYASRTHSQLSQAMQELKRSSYNYMKASVLGSRDMLCINNEVTDQEDHSMRLNMCRLKVATKTCHYNNRLEKKKDDPDICNRPIIDIEDMVNLGRKHTFCPYYMTKEQQQKADIIFTPYNYLLDPIARKSLGLKLTNAVVILDEGHNVEKVCEESASFELKSTDIALAIDEVTQIMKMLTEMPGLFEESPKGEIDPEQVATLKMILCDFEKVLDEVPIKTGSEVTHYPGDYIFEMLEKAHVSTENYHMLTGFLENLIQFLMAQNEGPFARKGKGMQLFFDFLTVVFASKASKEKMKHCYKVHIKEEEVKKPGRASLSTWVSKGTLASKNRILNYWCFSPGFGMDLIVSQGIKGLIITSGTLAPLRPLISELELDVKVRLENPHIVKENQICVKIVPKGPDGEPLNSSFRNRDNPKYVSSLGRAIVNLSRIIPNGLLIFFPSYPVMQKCQDTWQSEGIWGNITSQKTIFVEPRGKDAFTAAMNGYYEKIKDPKLSGAIFMGVCRGKVSEGLDFADCNGRAVIITGLPYPPLKDPRVILKQRYLDVCHAKDKEFLTGKDWYSLEASRAVNQAIGRVIRHRYDYGAILLLDERFNSPTLKNQMSRWLRDHIKVVNKYGEMIRELSQFFKKAQVELPTPESKSTSAPIKASFDAPSRYTGKGVFNFGQTTTISSSSSDDSVICVSDEKNENLMSSYLGTKHNPNGAVNLKRSISSRTDNKLENPKKRPNVVRQHSITGENRKNASAPSSASMIEYVTMVLLSLFIYWVLFW